MTHSDESDSEPMPNTQEVMDIVCDLEDQRGESVSETGHYEGELDTQYLLEYNSDDIYQMSFNFEGVMDFKKQTLEKFDKKIGISQAKKMRMDIQKGGGKKLDAHQDLEPENDGHQDLEPEKEKHPENNNRSQALDRDSEPEKEKHPENDNRTQP